MRRVLPRINGQLLRHHRMQRGLNVEEAATQAGCSAKRWAGWERSSGPVFGCTLEKIADAFDLNPKLLALDGAFVGLFSEIKNFGMGAGLAVLGVDPAHLHDACAEFMFSLGVFADYLGEAESAVAFCEIAVAHAVSAQQKTLASIRLAEFYGHLKRPQEGLKILTALERELQKTGSTDRSLDFWIQYQRGVLLMGSKNIARAVTILRHVRNHALLPVQRTSAKHQLANACLRTGAYRRAERLFQECLAERSKCTHRRAFEYHGLGEALAHQRGRRSDAVAAFCQALRIARRASFFRYVARISDTVAALGLASDPMWKKTVRYV